MKRPYLRIFVLVALFTLLSLLASLFIGPYHLSWQDFLAILTGQAALQDSFLLYQIRLPRLLLVFFGGIALTVAGYFMQKVAQNDLADPGLLGMNQGAGMMVALYFVYVQMDADQVTWLLPLLSISGSTLAALAVFAFAFDRQDGLQPLRLILSGLGFSAALSGATIFIISQTVDKEKIEFISAWLAGSIWGYDWRFVGFLLMVLLICLPLAFWRHRELDLISMEETAARSLGLHLQRERFFFLALAIILSASAITFTGNLAFIGLMMPHIANQLFRGNAARVLPLALLLGGSLLVLADTFTRTFAQGINLPTGTVIALFGAPYFFWLLFARQRRE